MIAPRSGQQRDGGIAIRMIAPLIDIRLHPPPQLITVHEEPQGAANAEEQQDDAQDAPGFLNFFAAAFVAPLAALVSHGVIG